jgi:Tfp pilus assembly protein PilO
MKWSALSPSERRLMAVMGLVAAVLLNLVLFKFCRTKYLAFREQIESKEREIADLELLASGKDVWLQRSAWVDSAQPRLENEALAGNNLLNALKETASKHGVTITKPQIGVAVPQGKSVAVPVQFEVRTSWKSLGAFVYELQGPGQFMVFQQARLKVDPNDKTLMLAEFTVAKWFAKK